MPYKGYTAVTLPKEVVDEVKELIEKHREDLRKIGIKKVSHIFERAWYNYKPQLEKEINQKNKE